MRSVSLLAGVACVLALGMSEARSQDAPRVVVSPDLNAPWRLDFVPAPVIVRPGTRQNVRPAARSRQREVVRRNAAIVAPRYTSQQFAPHVMRRPPPREAAIPAPRSRSEAVNGFPDRFLPQTVAYEGGERPGTLVIDTETRHLFLVLPEGRARRYGVGVGKPGFEWAGSHKVTRKAEWPSWRPPKEMIAREAAKGHMLPDFMKGGPENPLGARALYLGSTLYRIHGTNQPWTIGRAVSSGCIRMRNIDVVDLYERVPVGARVVVR